MKGYITPLLALILSLMLYFINLSTLPYLNSAYTLLRSLVYPLFEIKANVEEATRHAIGTYVFLKNVDEENKRLREDLEKYKLYKSQLLACESALKDMSKALGSPLQISNYPIIYASIIAYDPSSRDAFVIVNRGQDKGVSEGMLVFSGEDLVGMVDSVYGSSSRIRTVFSEEFTFSASVGDKAYIYRGGFPTGSLLHVKVDDEIRVGDAVYVRVPGRVFPQLKIGIVQGVSQDGKSFFKKVDVKPSVDIRRISLLTIISERL